VTDKIRVVVVDDVAETRDHLAKLLSFENDIEVVGSASSGEEALPMAMKLQPDVLLLDINMPGMDGIATAEQLSATVPLSAIVMMSVQGEPDYLRRSMLAGAREFLVKPFSADELSAAIRQVHVRERAKMGHVATMPVSTNGSGAATTTHERRDGRVVTFFSPKGGVGRTTIAVNAAVSAATELHQRVVVVDASLQFGDVGVLLNMSPKNNTIVDVVRELAGGADADFIDSQVVDHSSGVRVLLAPPSPEQAELVTPEHVAAIVGALRTTHDLVVALLTLEISNIKNLRQFLELVSTLGYADEKLKLVLNRADSAYGIRVQDVEQSIGRKIDHSIVSDGQTVVYALNRGVPFVLGNKHARVSQDVTKLTKTIAGERRNDEQADKAPAQPTQRKALLAWR
jgi:pilus assembly protein CpaE